MAVVYPWYLAYHHDSEYFDRLNKLEAEDSNRRFFQRIRDVLPKKIEESGLFYVLKIESLDGFAAYLSLKKYPNVWGVISMTPKNERYNIEFQCYIHEHKWSKIVISDLQFFELVKFDINPEPERKSLFFKKEVKEKPRTFTEKEFYYLIETDMKILKCDLVPGKFRYEEDKYKADWDVEEAKKYIQYHEYVIYSVKDGLIMSNTIRPNFMQRKLMYMMSQKNGEM